jgi:protein-tyrosine phosphatase
MVDVHTHILPGLDDGAPDLATSVAIAEQAAAGGVHTLVATPHIREDYDVRPEELAQRTAAVQAELDRHGLPVRVLPGGELAMTKVASLSNDELTLVSLAGGSRCMLLETPYGPVPASFEETAFALQLRGYTPLVAHPERNRTMRSAPGRLAALVERGALVQITAGALLGRMGRDVGRFSMELVEQGLAHVVASDVHRAMGGRASLAEARDALARRGLGALGEWMAEVVPSALIAGQAAPARPHAQPAPRISRLWRRGRSGA